VEPYLGARGRVAPYLLTNAIDAGDTVLALDLLDRMLHATSTTGSAMHGMQVMAMLVRHYESLLRIDSPVVRGEAEAGAVLGIKAYPAKLRLQTARRLGSRGIGTAFAHLARADLDLRGGLAGGRALDPDIVMELLVTRLCALAARSGRGAQSSGAGGRRR
jgi:DNA polymerase III delta subunit